jgi:hypothetical protein
MPVAQSDFEPFLPEWDSLEMAKFGILSGAGNCLFIPIGGVDIEGFHCGSSAFSFIYS